MKLIDRKKWITLFAVCAVLAIAARPFDMLTAKLLYRPSLSYGDIFYDAVPALAYAVCSFLSAAMMSCRNTKTTRKKNKRLTVVWALISVIFGAVASYYPFIRVDGINYYVIAGVTAAISGTSMVLGYVLFKEIYQKDTIVKIAERLIPSTLIITAVCTVALLIPRRACYEARLMAIKEYGSVDLLVFTKDDILSKTCEFVPVIPFVTASATVLLFAVLLKDVFPKLKFSGNWIFIGSCIWTAVVVINAVSSGRMYLSEGLYGILMGYAVVFCISFVAEQKEKSKKGRIR